MATTASEVGQYVGGGVKRKEDPKLLTGQGNFVENITPPGTVWMSVVRSIVAHARITSVNTKAARNNWWIRSNDGAWNEDRRLIGILFVAGVFA